MHFDILNDDAFSLSQLTLALNDLKHVPGRIGELGLFSEQGIATTSVSIERVGQTVKLVASAPRGSAGQTQSQEKRNLRSFNIVHLPQYDAIVADEIQNLRAFGSETEVQTMQALVNGKMEVMKTNLDVTIEFQRFGAIKGQVLDADGSTVLLDLYQEFNTSQQTVDMGLDVDTTKVKQKCVEVQRSVEAALGGLRYSGLRAMCSETYFDALVGHPAVEAAYDRWMSGEFKRTQQRDMNGGGGFWFGGIYWEEYRGQVGNQKFIADGEAYLIPEGVPNLFKTYYGPADYFETVNTMGLPYYARQHMATNGKRAELETQSNPLHLNTRPASVLRLLAA